MANMLAAESALLQMPRLLLPFRGRRRRAGAKAPQPPGTSQLVPFARARLDACLGPPGLHATPFQFAQDAQRPMPAIAVHAHEGLDIAGLAQQAFPGKPLEFGVDRRLAAETRNQPRPQFPRRVFPARQQVHCRAPDCRRIRIELLCGAKSRQTISSRAKFQASSVSSTLTSFTGTLSASALISPSSVAASSGLSLR